MLFFILSFLALAIGLCQEIEDGFQSTETYRAKFTLNKNEDEIEGARRNPYLNLPVMLQTYGVNTTSIEIIGRLLWHTTSNKVNVEAAYRLYRRADSAYPDIALIRILRASCFMTLSADSAAFLDLLNTALELEPSLYLRFLIEKRVIDSKRTILSTLDSSGATNNSDTFGNFQKFYV